MGLKDDLIEAKAQSALAAGANHNDIDTSAGSAIEVESELIKEAIVDFLTKCEFRITQLNANVVLEDFNIPSQQADILPTVVSTDIPYPGGAPSPPVNVPLTGGRNGVITKTIDVNKAGGTTGILDSTGYVYIGGDPDSQDGFDVNTLDGIRDFTRVELFREDIEDLL
jgi:hypothetical protein